ncbi:MAG TPA: cbb3-type cytochrome c oxidase N-terminal domain-containing protein [Saprospiraceae bacterium]|nr:c-type cytochrome [Saprospiraceae bacterium]HRO07599.1 cbb3-type cytochrome c oxidase N-terminal domain-containing protein [Saprospiraceae bacterium]HRO72034.1 cbb3-type cytochrome c oxidase N-terminal domain-containing protein [Saprospiraceae bacterium]HRP40882.1 cbb3-type cytochrome c oxidase N-terminal domain-containing protein [Saprospiraceae bacterium]
MMKKLSFTIMLYIGTLIWGADAFGQGSSQQDLSSTILTFIYNNIFVLLSLAVLVGVVSIALKLIWAFIDMQKVKLADQIGAISVEPSSGRGESTSFLRRLYDKAWNMAPVSKEENIDLGHEYDGIRELDNSLPPWWLWMFYGTIIFAGAYIWYYNVSNNGPNQLQEYEIAMEVAELQKTKSLSIQGNKVDENTVTALTDEASITEGKDLYITNCAACHGQLGEGTVGPNFTDKYWIHGGSVNDIFKTIKYGVPDKGMVSWKDLLGSSAIQKVSSYILTLQGTNPPNQKEKQGELYEPKVVEPEAAPKTDEASPKAEEGTKTETDAPKSK